MNELSPLTPRRTRAILEQLGHRPKKSLGQNFLIDPNIVRKSMELASVQSGEPVVEIGPGLGTLTRALLREEAEVYAIEQDRNLVEFLRNALQAQRRLHLIRGDACKEPLAGFNPKPGQPFKIVANLPYAISSPWMEAVLSSTEHPGRIVVLVQSEMADRMTASPGSKNMGAITLFLEGVYRRRPGHTVSSRCFYPRPAVDSVLFHLEKKEQAYSYHPVTRKVIRQIFTRRRKQVGSLARAFLPPPVARPWVDLLPSPMIRPSQIPFEQWKCLDEHLREFLKK